MAMFAKLKIGELPLFKLNFGIITLLAKKECASCIEKYRPICLLNVSSKVFSKVGTNHVTSIAHKVIRPTQSSYIPGRKILEGLYFYLWQSMTFVGRKWMRLWTLRRHMTR
jgi:hypothetical protein